MRKSIADEKGKRRLKAYFFTNKIFTQTFFVAANSMQEYLKTYEFLLKHPGVINYEHLENGSQ